MNAKWRAKRRFRVRVLLAVTASLLPFATAADYGNLAQQVRTEQHKSNFQLMLEQVRESSRQRAAAAPSGAQTPGGGRSTSTGRGADLGDSTQSLRLDPGSVTGPVPGDLEPASARRLRAKQAYDRDQRRILDDRQRRSALIARSRNVGPTGSDSFAAKRREMVRVKTQNRRLSVQRKLRR
jgi:hypothetical protein